MEKPMRLDKLLSSSTALSRKEAKRAIRAGRVLVNGMCVSGEDEKVTAGDTVTLDGQLLRSEQFVYYMMNKPSGVLSATKDASEKTVLDLMEISERGVFPVGRLDKDTEGLLILTNDGGLSHTLLSPKYHVEKVYEFSYEGELAGCAEEDISRGIDIGEKHLTKPGRLERLGEGRGRLTISEGKYHQVKRMVAKVGGRVTKLKRTAMAGIRLDGSLKSGEYRKLTPEEIDRLQQAGRKE